MFGWSLGIIAFMIGGYSLDVLAVEEYRYMVASLGYGTGIFGFIIGTMVEVKDKF